MVESLKKLSDVLYSFPAYLGEGIMDLLIVIVGGLVLGYFTSHYLYKSNELYRVEGWMLEKRFPIYKELFEQLEYICELYMLSPIIYEEAYQMLQKHGLNVGENAQQISGIFMDANKLSETFLKFDRYATQNRLLFDPKVAEEVNVFQNYFCFINRMHVLYKEQMDCRDIYEKKEVKEVEQLLLITLGVYLNDEFLQQVISLQNTIRISMNHLGISHRKKPDYSCDYYEKESGYMMNRMKDLKVTKDSESIRNLITEFVALGICVVDV